MMKPAPEWQAAIEAPMPVAQPGRSRDDGTDSWCGPETEAH